MCLKVPMSTIQSRVTQCMLAKTCCFYCKCVLAQLVLLKLAQLVIEVIFRDFQRHRIQELDISDFNSLTSDSSWTVHGPLSIAFNYSRSRHPPWLRQYFLKPLRRGLPPWLLGFTMKGTSTSRLACGASGSSTA